MKSLTAAAVLSCIAATSAFASETMKAVPTDPYDGRPMRMAVVEGQPVVYSIGKDGRDDGGLKDSKFETQPGDILFRLPPAKECSHSARITLSAQ